MLCGKNFLEVKQMFEMPKMEMVEFEVEEIMTASVDTSIPNMGPPDFSV